MTATNGRRFHEDGTLPKNGEVFVFGSNLAGRHGAGAAYVAKQSFGAKTGFGIGYSTKHGSKHSYAIPTKDANLNVLPIEAIASHVNYFRLFAAHNPNHTFFLTRIGCGLAGYFDWQIAPLFKGCGDNVIFPEEWANFVSIPVKAEMY